ncbi:STT3 domain-containing protein [Nanoarchaeota archaeon]
MNEEEQILEERKKKVVTFLQQKKEWIYYLGLAIVTWFGAIFIRTANIDKLKDVTGGWTLAPDLDPYLFLRWAGDIVSKGSLPAIDMMRYFPLGYETAGELPLVPYGIAYIHKFLTLFSSNIDIYYSAIIFPVVFFAGMTVVFFLLVRRIFRNYKFSDLTALIATAIFVVIPGFIHRTVAGVPEKESIGFFFMFLALYFMVVAWQQKEWKRAGLFGLLAGLSTGLMGLAWGGVTFPIVIISLAAFVYFFTAGSDKLKFLTYFGWIVGFTALLLPHARYGTGLFMSTTSGFSYFVLALYFVHLIIFKTNIKSKLNLNETRIPKKLISLLTILVLGLLVVLILMPQVIGGVANDAYTQLVKPFEGNRFTVTVAENNRPFFNSWKGSFGAFFWVFFFGSILLFYEGLKYLKSKDKNWLTVAFSLMLFGVVFTRIKPDSILNGSSPLSVFLFIGSMLLFLAGLFYFYFKEKEDATIDAGLILALAWVFFGLISARGAIRLLYFVYPIVALVGSFATVIISKKFFEIKDEAGKVIIGVLAITMILISCWSVYTYSQSSYNEVAYGSVPSVYNVQWQKAMGWVRENTSEDAVFAHWWDYGYWVQTIGERATVLDGGNSIVYWDHLLGRHVLTGETEKEAFEFLKTHDATHLLIDSTDIGKYSAYSSIGSDENYDRYSYIATFNNDPSATQERRNETLFVLNGGAVLDEDIIWKDKIFAGGSAGIAGFILPIENKENDSLYDRLKQPQAVIVDKGQQLQVPIKCAYLGEKKIFEGEGIDGCIYLIPSVTNQGMQNIGAGLWLSPRLMKSLLIKLYLFDEGEDIKLAHTENHPVIDELNTNYNLNLQGIALVNGGLIGPIKIWELDYPEDIETNPEYLERDYPEDKPGLWQVGR